MFPNSSSTLKLHTRHLLNHFSTLESGCFISASVDGSSPQRVWNYKGNIVIKDTTGKPMALSSFWSILFMLKPSSSLNSQMGFMNVLKFSAACFDILAWPLFALGYPLLMFILCLSTPSSSMLSMDPQVVMNWLFNESKKKFIAEKPFLFQQTNILRRMDLKRWRNYLLGVFDSSGNMLVMVSLSLSSSLHMTFQLRSTKPNVEVKEIKAPAAPEKKGEQVSTLMWLFNFYGADPREMLFIGSVKSLMLLKRDPSSQSNRDKKWGDGAKRCEWSNAAKEEVKVTEVTQRTFGGTAQWFCIHVSWLTKKIQPPSMRSASAERAAALVAAEIEACRDDRTPKIPLHEKVQKEWACAVASSQPKLKRPSIPTFKGRDIRPFLSS
ncbi:hypothetical protein CK203_113782 [Vitis vinifera]|uniref:Uncharacterized protein n=1 Tax=Vitis vinifera TaxID=29760 RepID=A0A438DLB8_VITVI|nr:hypothetical protein CK203_113782 [Vitis vinifera]